MRPLPCIINAGLCIFKEDRQRIIKALGTVRKRQQKRTRRKGTVRKAGRGYRSITPLAQYFTAFSSSRGLSSPPFPHPTSPPYPITRTLHALLPQNEGAQLNIRLHE